MKGDSELANELQFIYRISSRELKALEKEDSKGNWADKYRLTGYIEAIKDLYISAFGLRDWIMEKEMIDREEEQ